jgi:hypothetical protein
MAKISQKIVKSDESNGEETCFCGYGSYSCYHIDYMAERVSNIEELSNCE